MKEWFVKIRVRYEGYNGYDHDADFQYTVLARTECSAKNKAKKMIGGGHLQRGYVSSIYASTEKEIET